MTLNELLSFLREIEKNLRSSEVQDFFEKQHEDIRKRFSSFRQEVSFLVGKLTNAQIESIAKKLDELSDDLNKGIDELERGLGELKDAVAILNTFTTILGLAARISVLV